MIYKALTSKVDDVDEKGRVVVAANAFDNVDADEDISVPGSYQKTLKEHFNRSRWFYNHDKTILLGVPIEGVEAYPHLKMTGQLNMKKQISRDVYEDYRLFAEYGKSLEHSVGVNAMQRDNADKRRVLEWKLWEYSTLSSWGANDQTPMLGIKSMKSLEDAVTWLELCQNKANYSDEKHKAIEKSIITLRSLLSEPEQLATATTPQVEPNEKGNESVLQLKQFRSLEVLKQFRSQLKSN